MSKDLLLEVGTEEIPARFLPPARAALLQSAERDLAAWQLGGAARVLGTPRRLVLIVEGLEEKQADFTETVTGPGWDRAFADGQPTPAAAGFAKKHGIDPAALQRIETAKGVFAGFTAQRQGRNARDLLVEHVPRWLGAIPFGKNMRWEASGVRFARPIRWLTALLGDEILPIEFAGLAAGNDSRGHRFFGGGFTIRSAADYLTALPAQHVMIDPRDRRDRIREAGDALAAAAGLRVDWDEALLDEVADLVEWPTPLLGSFDAAYLELPDMVLEAPMKKHQRYFPVRGGDGKLAPRFLIVSNQPADPAGKIVAGNRRVLSARLADAKYFWDHDRARPLAAHAEALTRITWQEGLGTLAQLHDRVKKLALEILPWLDAHAATVSAAADLYLADLGTQMVYEFGELQGEIGAVYAGLEGQPEAVVAAIRGAHLPKSADDPLPATADGRALAIAHRIDLIVGNLIAGHDVTGSQDPYGMRRAAIGLFRMFAELDTDLGPADVCRTMLEHYRRADYLGVAIPADIETRIERFWQTRLVAYLENLGHGSAGARAAANAANGHVRGALRRLHAIAAYFADDAARERFLDTYKRFRNIAKDAQPAENLYDWADGETAFFAEALRDADKSLDERLRRTAREANLIGPLTPIVAAAEKLFADVTINSDDAATTARRKSLVKAAQRCFDRVAVFDYYISGESS